MAGLPILRIIQISVDKIPGSTSGDADSLFQEGIRIPVIRIRQNGKLIPSVMDLLLDNTRVPQEREGDLTAQMSANLIGVQRIQEAYARYQDDLIECMKELVGYSERRVRAVVQSFRMENTVIPIMWMAVVTNIRIRCRLK